MSTALVITAWTLCVALLLLTVACQRPPWSWLRTLKYLDVAALIPAWTFFAPRPGSTDTRVLWREKLLDGSISPWHELLPPVGGPRRALWNPQKRQTKLITDAGPMVVRMAARNPKNQLILISLPYIVLLHAVSALSASPLVAARQFLVVQTTTEDDVARNLKPLFASRWHALVAEVRPEDSLVRVRQPAESAHSAELSLSAS